MGVTLRVRPGDGGTIVAVSGEVDVCTEAPPQQALLRIIRERSARLMLDLSGVSFMDCAGLRSALAAPRPAREAAAMRCALASLLALTGRAMEAMTEAQTVVTNSGVPADLRDQATVALMWAWLGLRGNQQADQLAGTILAEPSTKRGELVVAAMVALAVARWDSGRAAEALDLAAQAVRQATDRPYEAIRSLEEALREYDRLGARRGVARTRRRLRQLGVRRRYWASEQRPAAGWASLTDIEQATARLVAEGLTNQRIADQLFISTHTVAFHLRQVFRKLDIRSRVDLARIALEHARPEAAQTP